MDLRYFKTSEFDSPDLPGSGDDMNPEFLKMIDKARGVAGVPFSITSGMRSEKHNRKVGGVETSSHLIGRAADIACAYSSQRFKIIEALIAAGFNRIGIADTFIHCDNDPNKASHVIWLYS